MASVDVDSWTISRLNISVSTGATWNQQSILGEDFLGGEIVAELFNFEVHSVPNAVMLIRAALAFSSFPFAKHIGETKYNDNQQEHYAEELVNKPLASRENLDSSA